MDFGLVVHGGAWAIPDEAVEGHLQGVSQACSAAYTMLADGRSALDAVEHAVALMELDPTFDAGVGSFLNQVGEVEMDAIIATSDLRLGSVCAVQNITHPVKLARVVMEKTTHVCVVGKGANMLAEQHGITSCAPEDLLVGRELERYRLIKAKKSFVIKDTFRHSPHKPNGMGTVGCVAKDREGRLALAVSTGGTAHKLCGRVGDTPLWGSGGYVEPIGAAAATGYGEDLVRILATRQCIDYVRQGLAAQEAVVKTIQDLQQKVNGLGGLICITPSSLGLAFNTPRMAFARQTNDDPLQIGIERGDAPNPPQT